MASIPMPHGDGDEERKSRVGAYLLFGLLLVGGIIWWVSTQSVTFNSSGKHAVVVDDEPFGELVEITLRGMGYTVDLYDDCDDIVYKARTTVYFVDQYGHQNGLDYCIPKILRKHIRPIILMSAGNLYNTRLPEHVGFLMKNGNITTWVTTALGIAADLMMP